MPGFHCKVGVGTGTYVEAFSCHTNKTRILYNVIVCFVLHALSLIVAYLVHGTDATAIIVLTPGSIDGVKMIVFSRMMYIVTCGFLGWAQDFSRSAT